MATQHFQFELYRLNIVDTDELFPDFGQRIRSDQQILTVLSQAASPDFDFTQETKKATYKWGIREFTDYGQISDRGHIASIVLAKSTLKKDGLIVTDKRIVTGTSDSHPPLASMMMLFFDVGRHLVAAEYHGELSQNKKWKSALSRYTRSLYEDLENGGIREYLQDMKNPGGLSKSEVARPYASVALAEKGYKSGEVLFEGIKEGKFAKVRSSEEAARGKLEILKDYVRGISANAKAKETQQALKAITSEIDRLHPQED